ncbi:MAG: endonuclease/exonuclease/phosphatase family protein, partial [Muribaculaceae bacterium]|nr:endonuclease/exonuclease/phosphatase family protein [Muribaculaceae bacterium]
QKVTIFNVHLQSFSLVPEDKEMFKKLTRLKGSETEIAQMRSHLVNKIREAAPQRVLDTEELIKYIRKFGGPNVIVCGDFNDVPGSYPLRMLADEHLKEVYPEVGFGPMITYNANRFYFRIDHILYKGDLTPLSMKRGSVKSSDHYPVIATFEIPDN